MKTKRVVSRLVPVLMVVACVGGTGCVGSSKVRATASALDSSHVAAQDSACCASAHNNRGISCAIAGRLDEARSALCRAVSLKPRKALYRNNLAAVLIDQRRYDSAFRQLLAAHGSAIGHYNLQHMLSLKFSDDGGQTSLVARLMDGRPTAGIPSASPLQVEDGPALAPPEPIQRPSTKPSGVVQDAMSDVQPQREEQDSSGLSGGVEPRNVVPREERSRKGLDRRPPRNVVPREERPRNGLEMQPPQDVVPIQTPKTTLRFIIPESAIEDN